MVKHLKRDASNVKIAGVCSGVANYFKLDPVLVRVIWAILIFFGGFGIFAYIIAWLVMPEK